jgi:hypothetical protein
MNKVQYSTFFKNILDNNDFKNNIFDIFYY